MAGKVENGHPVPAIVAMYDEIGKTRPLTKPEVLRLERAIRRARSESGERQAAAWTRDSDRKLRSLLLSSKRPAQIAIVMRRTERAIWRRMYVLSWTVRLAEQGRLPLPAPGSKLYVQGIPARTGAHGSIPMPRRNVGG